MPAPLPDRADGQLFGERQSRVVIEMAPEHLGKFTALADDHAVWMTQLGAVGGDTLTIDDLVAVSVDDLADA